MRNTYFSVHGLKLLLSFITLISFYGVNAQFAQWRGPNRDGIFTDSLLLNEWPENGPEKLFSTNGIGKGNSSTVATTTHIYTTGIKDTTEYLTCLDLQGNIVWQKAFGRCWNKTFPESRTTPTIDETRIYVLSGMDVMSCFNSNSGDKIWSVDIHKKYNSSWDMFGVSESVLVSGNLIFTTPAGENTTVIALDKFSGELVWKTPSLKAHRSNMSPIIINHCGNEYLITSTQTHFLGIDIKKGTILWKYQYNFLSPNGDNTTILANTPVYSDSCLWISNGWDVKSVMLEIAPDGKSVKEKFTDHTFDNQNHGVVLVDGYLYGSNFTGRQSGKWICMNWKTGEIIWIADYFTKGPILSANGMLYIMDEKRGNMALVEANPKEFKTKGSFRITDGSGPYWSRPAIYNRMLLVRHGDVLVAYNIGKSS